MRKIVIVIAILGLMVGLFVGCGTKTAKETETGDLYGKPTEKEEVEEPVIDTSESDQFDVLIEVGEDISGNMGEASDLSLGMSDSMDMILRTSYTETDMRIGLQVVVDEYRPDYQRLYNETMSCITRAEAIDPVSPVIAEQKDYVLRALDCYKRSLEAQLEALDLMYSGTVPGMEAATVKVEESIRLAEEGTAIIAEATEKMKSSH